MRQTSSFLTVGLTREELEDLHFNEEIWKEVEAILADDKKVVSLVSARDLNRGIYRWIKAGFQPVIPLKEENAEGNDDNLVARLKSSLESSSSDVNRLREELTISNNDNKRLASELGKMSVDSSKYEVRLHEFGKTKTHLFGKIETLKSNHDKQIAQLRESMHDVEARNSENIVKNIDMRREIEDIKDDLGRTWFRRLFFHSLIKKIKKSVISRIAG